MATTVFPNVNVSFLVDGLAALFGVSAAVAAGVVVRYRRGVGAMPDEPALPRDTWRMPPLALLERPRWSRGRTSAMYVLRGYLLLAVVLLFVKAIELGAGHQ